MPYRLRVFNVESTVGVRFKRPIALNDLLEKRFPNKAVEVLGDFGVDSSGFNLEQRDRLFDYRLSFHLFVTAQPFIQQMHVNLASLE